MAFKIKIYTSRKIGIEINETIKKKDEAEKKGKEYIELGGWYRKHKEDRFYPAKSIHHIRILEKRDT
ncbi:unnamed protein product [marine sediment metagenome]|uniref:Uncharacterized protein n=1 Tax=marine sediment metagenome TaxID=412755 RepID=X1HWG3_9ZZZZ